MSEHEPADSTGTRGVALAVVICTVVLLPLLQLAGQGWTSGRPEPGGMLIMLPIYVAFGVHIAWVLYRDGNEVSEV